MEQINAIFSGIRLEAASVVNMFVRSPPLSRNEHSALHMLCKLMVNLLQTPSFKTEIWLVYYLHPTTRGDSSNLKSYQVNVDSLQNISVTSVAGFKLHEIVSYDPVNNVPPTNFFVQFSKNAQFVVHEYSTKNFITLMASVAWYMTQMSAAGVQLDTPPADKSADVQEAYNHIKTLLTDDNMDNKLLLNWPLVQALFTLLVMLHKVPTQDTLRLVEIVLNHLSDMEMHATLNMLYTIPDFVRLVPKGVSASAQEVGTEEGESGLSLEGQSGSSLEEEEEEEEEEGEEEKEEEEEEEDAEDEEDNNDSNLRQHLQEEEEMAKELLENPQQSTSIVNVNLKWNYRYSATLPGHEAKSKTAKLVVKKCLLCSTRVVLAGPYCKEHLLREKHLVPFDPEDILYETSELFTKYEDKVFVSAQFAQGSTIVEYDARNRGSLVGERTLHRLGYATNVYLPYFIKVRWPEKVGGKRVDARWINGSVNRHVLFMVGHSPTPNVEVRMTEGSIVQLVALRDIQPGEKLTRLHDNFLQQEHVKYSTTKVIEFVAPEEADQDFYDETIEADQAAAKDPNFEEINQALPKNAVYNLVMNMYGKDKIGKYREEFIATAKQNYDSFNLPNAKRVFEEQVEQKIKSKKQSFTKIKRDKQEEGQIELYEQVARKIKEVENILKENVQRVAAKPKNFKFPKKTQETQFKTMRVWLQQKCDVPKKPTITKPEYERTEALVNTKVIPVLKVQCQLSNQEKTDIEQFETKMKTKMEKYDIRTKHLDKLHSLVFDEQDEFIEEYFLGNEYAYFTYKEDLELAKHDNTRAYLQNSLALRTHSLAGKVEESSLKRKRNVEEDTDDDVLMRRRAPKRRVPLIPLTPGPTGPTPGAPGPTGPTPGAPGPTGPTLAHLDLPDRPYMP